MFNKVFMLSKEADKSLIQSSIYMSMFNIATLVPAILLAEVTGQMLDIYFGGNTEKLTLWGYFTAAFILSLLIYLAYRATYRKKYFSSGKEDMRLRMELADKIRKLPLSYIGKRNLSDLTSIIMDDVTVAANTIATVATELISGFLSGIITLVALAFYNWKLSLCLAICLPVVVIVMGLCRKISEGTNLKNKKKKLDISDGLQEYLENIKVLRTAQRVERYQNNLAKKIKKVLPGLIAYELISGFTVAISYNVMRIGLGIVIIVGSSMLISGEISVVTFLMFLYIAVRIYEPITKGCEMLGELIYSLVSVDRIRAVLNYPEQQGDEAVSLNQYDVVFEHVTFGYEDENVIKDVSFTAKQGEITALVGPSGCGKSTLCKLAARFWDVDEGTIKVGGIDIKQIAPETLLKLFNCFSGCGFV